MIIKIECPKGPGEIEITRDSKIIVKLECDVKLQEWLRDILNEY